jgi:hypothetical protein
MHMILEGPNGMKSLIAISLLILLSTVVTTTHKTTFALHDSHLDVNTWLTQDNTTATTIDLNSGPASPTMPEEEVIPEEGGSEEEEEEESDTGDGETPDEENGDGGNENGNNQDLEE